MFEGDVLATELALEAVHPLAGGGGLVELRAQVRADRGLDERVDVLDWRLVGLMA